jgi:stress response protein YsnF
MDREAPEAEFGDEEVVLQVFEEEVVVSKRVVLKEEIRLRKRVVEDEEVAEVDLRKEEVEIDDQTKHDAGRARRELTGQPLPSREDG